MTKPLQVAVAGSGYFSQFHYDAWRRLPTVELIAAASIDVDSLGAVAETFEVPRLFGDVALMLDEMRPDLLDIVTPPETHKELVGLAAERRIDVICQKPLAPTLAEAEEVVATARAAGIALIVHENFRFQPWYRHIKTWLEAGGLGDVYGARFSLRPGDGQGPNAYLARQPYFQNMERFLIHETGIHFVDVFRYLLGEPVAVTARLRRLNPAIKGEDAGHVVFDFTGNRYALFDGNRLSDHAADNRRLTMGEMILEGSAGVLTLDGDAILRFRPHDSDTGQEIAYAWSDRGFAGDCVYALQAHVVEHLVRGTAVENDGAAYLRNVRIEEAIYAADREGRRIALED